MAPQYFSNPRYYTYATQAMAANLVMEILMLHHRKRLLKSAVGFYFHKIAGYKRVALPKINSSSKECNKS